MSNKNWTQKEKDFLLENHQNFSYKEIASCLGRSHNSVSCMAYYLGIRKTSSHKFWTKEEVDYLMNSYQKEEKNILINKLERSWGAIVKKANSLGITRKKEMIP